MPQRMTILWSVSYRCQQEGPVVEWFTTQKKAYARAAKIEAPSTVEMVGVPKTKVCLCQFLNQPHLQQWRETNG